MNLHLQPRQFLVLYNCIKNYENQTYISKEEEEVLMTLKTALEDAIIGAFERIESQSNASAFDKWIKSEKNKIEGLEKEIEKIRETVPQQDLVTKFQPVKRERTKGRPKKSR